MPVPLCHTSHTRSVQGGPRLSYGTAHIRDISVLTERSTGQHGCQSCWRCGSALCQGSRPSGEQGPQDASCSLATLLSESLDLPTVYRGSLGPCMPHGRRDMKKVYPADSHSHSLHSLSCLHLQNGGVIPARVEHTWAWARLPTGPQGDCLPWAVIRGFKADTQPGNSK